ncbi:aa3-type cytochrome oxidase subunit II [Motilibacter rhizosphaerae]|uniref:aa3-type cytochrome oxidase subunit II n=1 Tax=Motilibacter rhizosphaerae TaxID=598652 RepID=UPI00102AF9A8|nr:cytochrome c oxidase subunit II [Motilibacter rhizosphaerae]
MPAVALLAGCSTQTKDQWERAGLPAPATDHAKTVARLWEGAWVAALLVGAIVWALIFAAAIIYRRRSTDTGLPPQVRYNLPVEVLYTTLPIVMIMVYFFFTAQDQDKVDDLKGDAQVHITVVGKQWSWDFNYVGDPKNPASTATTVHETGTPAYIPTLYLPVGQKVEFTVLSRDVIHSFWVPPFLFKRDVVPGLQNRFELTPTKIGTFPGKCAELCGTYHSRMLFNVKVVSPQDYQAELQRLRAAGQTGEYAADGRRRTGKDIQPESEKRAG